MSQDIQNNKNNKLCEHLNKITDTLFMYTFPFLTYVLHYNTMQPPHAAKQLRQQVTTYVIAQCHNPENHSQNLTKTTYKLEEE